MRISCRRKTSGNKGGDANDCSGFIKTAAQGDRNRFNHAWRAVARAVVPKVVDAFARRIDAHEVRQARNSEPESNSRANRLQERVAVVTVTFELHVFKVERLVAKRRSFPGKGYRSWRFTMEIFFRQGAVFRKSSRRRHDLIRNIQDRRHASRIGTLIFKRFVHVDFAQTLRVRSGIFRLRVLRLANSFRLRGGRKDAFSRSRGANLLNFGRLRSRLSRGNLSGASRRGSLKTWNRDFIGQSRTLRVGRRTHR